MPRVNRISAASLVSLIMCAGLAYACAVPPVRVLPEEHETEQESEREFVEREQLLRRRDSAPQRLAVSGTPCPSLAWRSGNLFPHGKRHSLVIASEAMQRNGLGAPLLL